jgi:hypothetical protein
MVGWVPVLRGYAAATGMRAKKKSPHSLIPDERSEIRDPADPG